MSDRALTPARALALGMIQGPTELLPVSSSAHLNLLPRIAGWDWEAVDPEDRKAFEVSAHVGTAVALLWTERELIGAELAALDARRISVIALSFAVPAAAGLAFERLIERRLGSPRATAVGLVAGSVAMVLADRSPQRRGPGVATAADGLALGAAQAAALLPGVSRNGATLAAARARGFTREQAAALSRTVALPVIAGAALLKGVRLHRRGMNRAAAEPLAITAAAAAGSTVIARRALPPGGGGALWRYAVYRLGLAAAALMTARSD